MRCGRNKNTVLFPIDTFTYDEQRKMKSEMLTDYLGYVWMSNR